MWKFYVYPWNYALCVAGCKLFYIEVIENDLIRVWSHELPSIPLFKPDHKSSGLFASLIVRTGTQWV